MYQREMPSKLRQRKDRSKDAESKTLKNTELKESENKCLSSAEELLNESTTTTSAVKDKHGNHKDADRKEDANCDGLKVLEEKLQFENEFAYEEIKCEGIINQHHNEKKDDKSENLVSSNMLSKIICEKQDNDNTDNKSGERSQQHEMKEKIPEGEATESRIDSDNEKVNKVKRENSQSQYHEDTHTVTSQSAPSENIKADDKYMKEDDLHEESRFETGASKKISDVSTVDMDEDNENDDPKSENVKKTCVSESDENDKNDDMKKDSNQEDIIMNSEITSKAALSRLTLDAEVKNLKKNTDSKSEEDGYLIKTDSADSDEDDDLKEVSDQEDSNMKVETTSETGFSETSPNAEIKDLKKNTDSKSEEDGKLIKTDSADSDENDDLKEDSDHEDSNMKGETTSEIGVSETNHDVEHKGNDEKVESKPECDENLIKTDSADSDENDDMKEDSKGEEKKQDSNVASRDDTDGKLSKNKIARCEVGESASEDKSQHDTKEHDKSKKVESDKDGSNNSNSGQSEKKSFRIKEPRTHVGRKGDPRMHASVAAKIGNPTLKLFQALIQGGFEYNCDKDTEKDEDGVSLVQRKNQLRRRLRKLNIPRDNKVTRIQALLTQSRTNPMPMQGDAYLNNSDQAMKYPLLPMAMPYQSQHIFQMAQQFGFPFQPGLTTEQQVVNDNSTTVGTPQGNGNDDENLSNPTHGNSVSNSTQSNMNGIGGDQNNLHNFPITPYFPTVSAFGYPPFQNLVNNQPQNHGGQGNGMVTENDSKKESNKSSENSEKSLEDSANPDTLCKPINSENSEKDGKKVNEYTTIPVVDKTRLNKSCDRCRKRKVKCDGKIPCNVCFHDRNRLRKKKEKNDVDFKDTDDDCGIRCVYSYSMKRGPPAGKSEKRKRKKKNKSQQGNVPEKSFSSMLPQQPLNPAMPPQFFNPLYNQMPNINPPNMISNTSNMPILPNNVIPFNNNYPPYPLPFTNNPVTDSIYSQAILAAARSVLMTSQNQPDDPSETKLKSQGGTDNEKTN